MRRIASLWWTGPLAGLFVLGLGLRVFGLDRLPSPDAVEAWYPVQVHLLLRGKAFEAVTPYATVFNPLFAALHVPGLMLLKPSLWLLRAPAVLCGLAAIGLVYELGRRMFGKATGLIAAAVLAILPIAILDSRIAVDSAETPLLAVLMLYFAFRSHRLGLFLTAIAGPLIQPTNFYLLPVVLGVFLAREFMGTSANDVRRLHAVLLAVAVPSVSATTLGLETLAVPDAGPSNAVLPGASGLLKIPAIFQMLIQGELVSATTGLALAIAACAALVACLAARRMAQQKQWDRVALVVGFAISLVAFGIMHGVDPRAADWASGLGQAVFLVVPLAFAASLTAVALLVEATTPKRVVLRNVQYASLIVVGVGLLAFQGAVKGDTDSSSQGGAAWSLRSVSPSRYQRAVSTIRTDIDQSRYPWARRIVLTEDDRLQQPIQYLSLKKKRTSVVPYSTWELLDANGREAKLLQLLRGGSYVVCRSGSQLEAEVRTLYQSEGLQRWEIAGDVRESLVVYRKVRSEGMSAVASKQGSSRTAPDSTRR